MSLESAFDGGRQAPVTLWPEPEACGMTYWVIGGEYEDTSFQRIVAGRPKERHGPFATREDAMAFWRTKAMATIDNACVRFHLEKVGSEAFWVVGGRYKDTRFAETRDGTPEERIGPFRSFEEAKAAWRAKAMETVDDALARYRVEGA